jgi:hypothetical protein
MTRFVKRIFVPKDVRVGIRVLATNVWMVVMGPMIARPVIRMLVQNHRVWIHKHNLYAGGTIQILHARRTALIIHVIPAVLMQVHVPAMLVRIIPVMIITIVHVTMMNVPIHAIPTFRNVYGCRGLAPPNVETTLVQPAVPIPPIPAFAMIHVVWDAPKRTVVIATIRNAAVIGRREDFAIDSGGSMNVKAARGLTCARKAVRMPTPAGANAVPIARIIMIVTSLLSSVATALRTLIPIRDRVLITVPVFTIPISWIVTVTA